MRIFFPLLISVLCFFSQSVLGVRAEVERNDHGALCAELRLPVFQWTDPGVRPRALVLAIHGLTLHSGLYDEMACHLARSGFFTYAVDLRGFGRWWKEGEKDIDYARSEEDITRLAAALRRLYPLLPIYVLGESMGGNIAVKIAVHNPGLFNGLILSSPAIVLNHAVPKEAYQRLPSEIIHPKRLTDVKPFIARFVSSNDQVTQQILEDPNVRTKLGTWEMLLSRRELAGIIQAAGAIPASLPVLFLQGGQDRHMKLVSVFQFCSRLKSEDLTIRWFPRDGHVLLETAHYNPNTLTAISDWLAIHCPGGDNRAQAAAR